MAFEQALGLLPSVFGQRQVANAPQTPQFGGGPQMGGLLGPSLPGPNQDLMQFLQQSPAVEETDPVGGLVANQPASQAAGALPSNAPVPGSELPTNAVPEGTPAESQGLLGDLGQRAGGFFGNLDQTFQSPSKAIGIGLLGRMNPALGAAGLLAGGLLGPNKVF